MATHSSILAWRIPGTGEPGGLLSTGSHRVGHDWSDLAAAAAAKEKDFLSSFREKSGMLASELALSYRTSPTEGNGTPLQYSSLENPMDGAAW